MTLRHLPSQTDLEHICVKISSWIKGYQGQEVLIYGGTGFIGRWLATSLIEADKQFSLNMRIQIITRDAYKARQLFGIENSKRISFIEHDFIEPKSDTEVSADIVFQGATTSDKLFQETYPETMYTSSVNATKHASLLMSKNLDKPTIIHLSSGAIYKAEGNLHHFQQGATTMQIKHGEAYSLAKIHSESILEEAFLQGRIYYQSPRLFAFYGPLLPLKKHFAIGNFLSDGLSNKKIMLRGNPNTTRSYMYPTDLVYILMRLHSYREYAPINIGSDEAITMKDLANLISELTSKTEVVILNPDAEVSIYVPEIDFIRKELKISTFTSLESGILKWKDWLNCQ